MSVATHSVATPPSRRKGLHVLVFKIRCLSAIQFQLSAPTAVKITLAWREKNENNLKIIAAHLPTKLYTIEFYRKKLNVLEMLKNEKGAFITLEIRSCFGSTSHTKRIS